MFVIFNLIKAHFKGHTVIPPHIFNWSMTDNIHTKTLASVTVNTISKCVKKWQNRPVNEQTGWLTWFYEFPQDEQPTQWDKASSGTKRKDGWSGEKACSWIFIWRNEDIKLWTNVMLWLRNAHRWIYCTPLIHTLILKQTNSHKTIPTQWRSSLCCVSWLI